MKQGMTKTFLALAGLLVVGIPLFSFAATYHYVSVEGDVEAVEANSAAEALMTAPNIHPNSGVAIDRGFLEANDDVDVVVGGTGGADTYAYVDSTGQVRTITAQSPAAAIAGATNIHPQSGVAIVTSNDANAPLEN